jgi:hypothetical protein
MTAPTATPAPPFRPPPVVAAGLYIMVRENHCEVFPFGLQVKHKSKDHEPFLLNLRALYFHLGIGYGFKNGPRTDHMDYYELADSMAERYGLDPDIFRRQIQQESGFQEGAVSPVGAIGLGQVMPATAADPGYGVTPLAADRMTDPEENLRFSAEYMRAMLDRNEGDYSLALAAYNAGQGAVDDAGGIPAFEETQNYVSSILGTGSEGIGSLSTRPQGRPDTTGGVEAALRLLLEEDGGSEGKDYNSAMSGLSMLESAFSAPAVAPIESTASVRSGAPDSSPRPLSRFEGLASLGGR